LNYDFEYTKTNQFKNDFKIIVELAIIDVDQKLSLSISHGWQIDNHITPAVQLIENMMVSIHSRGLGDQSTVASSSSPNWVVTMVLRLTDVEFAEIINFEY